jgi:hypothetical protein
MTELASLCAIFYNPFVGITTVFQIKAKSTFYELWTLYLFSAKAIRIVRGAASDSLLVTRYLQRDQITEDQTDTTQNTNEVYEKFIQSFCSNI